MHQGLLPVFIIFPFPCHNSPPQRTSSTHNCHNHHSTPPTAGRLGTSLIYALLPRSAATVRRCHFFTLREHTYVYLHNTFQDCVSTFTPHPAPAAGLLQQIHLRIGSGIFIIFSSFIFSSITTTHLFLILFLSEEKKRGRKLYLT